MSANGMLCRRGIKALCLSLSLVFGVAFASKAQAFTVNEFPVHTAASGPAGITVGPDNKIWFSESTAAQIGNIDPNTKLVTEYGTGITSGAKINNITVGPDNNLWFTENNKDIIGKITTAGVVTEYKLPSNPTCITTPSTCVTPRGITSGPNGLLWFAQNNGSIIGAMDINGNYTAHSFTSSTGSNPNPRHIVQFPGGNLWFTEDTGKIGEMDGSGNLIGEFTPSSVPFDITVGPDSALWFSEEQGFLVGRIDTAGNIQEFAQGINNAPHRITTGPDGNIWFSEQDGGFGWVFSDLSGGFFDFGMPNQSVSPEGIVTGPDKNIWMTEKDPTNGNKIAQLV